MRWKSIFERSLLVGGVALSAWSARADALTSPLDAVAALCQDGQCQPVITQIQFFGRNAYRLTDGKSEAIIVPQIGRIMKFGRVGGPNLLWNAPTPDGVKQGWINYGGDKNWLAPQSEWPRWGNKVWPPDSAFDGDPQPTEVLSGGKLQMTSPLSPATGVRFVRTMYFNAKGEFVIEQTAKKEKGDPIRASVWSITQAVPGQAVFVPTNPTSAYEDGFHLLNGEKSTSNQTVERVNSNLLRIVPRSDGQNWKIGADSPISAIASVSNGVAFLQKTALPKGDYPDGVNGVGFPVELYVNAAPKTYYCELELLGPLQEFHIGSAWTHTVRWSLHDMPSQDATSDEVADAVERLLTSN